MVRLQLDIKWNAGFIILTFFLTLTYFLLASSDFSFLVSYNL